MTYYDQMYIPDDKGLILESDNRDYQYGAIFGEKKDVPRKFIHQIPDELSTPYQGRVPCCVSCAFTFINKFNSYANDNLKLDLSFRKVHAETGEYNIGRSLYGIAKYLQKKGQPQTKYCDNNVYLSPADFMDARLDAEGTNDAYKRTIGDYSFVNINNRQELMSAVMEQPVVFTYGGNNDDWSRPIIKQTMPIRWYHAVVCIGWDLDEGVWYIKNWWKDETRKVDINYPLTGAMSFRDLPDEENSIMLKTLRAVGTQDVYVISGNQKLRIPDSDTLHYFMGKLPILKETVEVTKEELDKYTEGETMPSVKLMRTLEPICADIFLNE